MSFLLNLFNSASSCSFLAESTLSTEELYKKVQAREEIHHLLDYIFEHTEKQENLCREKINTIKEEWQRHLENLQAQIPVDEENKKTWQEEQQATVTIHEQNTDLLTILDAAHTENLHKLKKLSRLQTLFKYAITQRESKYLEEISEQADQLQQLKLSLEKAQKLNFQLQAKVEEQSQSEDEQKEILEQFQQVALKDSQNRQVAQKIAQKKRYWKKQARDLIDQTLQQDREIALLREKCQEQERQITSLAAVNVTINREKQELEEKAEKIHYLEDRIEQYEQAKTIPNFIKHRISDLEKRIDDLSIALDNEQSFHERDLKKIEKLTAEIKEKNCTWEAFVKTNQTNKI